MSGQSTSCTIEDSPLQEYDYLVRFKSAAGNLVVTVRVSEVEQLLAARVVRSRSQI